MKLTDLRDELTARADSTDETPDLLDGVHRKITQTKRRRTAGAAGAVGVLAAFAAFAFIVPGLINSTPQPAEDDVPRDYTKGGLTLHGFEDADRLDKGWIGDVGQSTLDFSWVPGSQNIRFAGYCTNDPTRTWHYTVTVNDHVVGTSNCVTDPDSTGSGFGLQADNVLWLDAPVGKPAHVVAQLTDVNGRPVRDADTQIALGIYRSADGSTVGPPTQVPPTSADDYVKDGIRYRTKVGGDTLLAAEIADRGKNSFEFEFTAPGGPISLSDFCTATSPGIEPQYQLNIKFNGSRATSGGCTGESTDAIGGFTYIQGGILPAGQRVKVTGRLEDKNGRAISRPREWIGLGIYTKGKQRIIDDTFLDEVTEYNGHKYRLAEVKLADARTTKELELATPADQPFLVASGSSTLSGDAAQISVTGLTGGTNNTAGGIGTAGEGARPAGTVKLQLSAGRHTGGHLVLALYLPAD